jgi:hypothetical protein
MLRIWKVCLHLLHFLKFNKQMLTNDYFKTLKGRRVFVIYINCERVNIPDKLPHSKRHVIQSSFSFSFNNWGSNNFP